jgi:hypothetical protein
MRASKARIGKPDFAISFILLQVATVANWGLNAPSSGDWL